MKKLILLIISFYIITPSYELCAEVLKPPCSKLFIKTETKPASEPSTNGMIQALIDYSGETREAPWIQNIIQLMTKKNQVKYPDFIETQAILKFLEEKIGNKNQLLKALKSSPDFLIQLRKNSLDTDLRPLFKILEDIFIQDIVSNKPQHLLQMIQLKIDKIKQAITKEEIQKMRSIKAPKALRKGKKLISHGETRLDPYYWFKDFENQKDQILKHLKKENAYTKNMLMPVENLQKKLFEEMKGRIQKDDQGVPFKIGDYFYELSFEEKSEHPKIYRKKNLSNPKRELILDANELSKKSSFFHLGAFQPSPSHKLLAYTLDQKGRRNYTLFIKDIKTKKIVQKIENISSHFTWTLHPDGVLIYITRDSKTLRDHRIEAFNLKTKEKKLIYYEKDLKYSVFVELSLSKEFIFIHSASSDSSEVHFLPSRNPFSPIKVFQKRRKNHLYSVSHAGSYFYILSNFGGAKNFKLLRTLNEENTSIKHWKEVFPYRKDVYIQDFLVFENDIVLLTQENGTEEFEIFNRKTKERKKIPFKEKGHSLYFSNNFEYQAPFFRFLYTSLKTPAETIDYFFKTNKKVIQKVQKVLGPFKKENYTTNTLFAKAKDGKLIPISMVYRKGIKLNGKNPTLLYGYGAYGISVYPEFSPQRLSLLDRGFIFAIAHVRGGAEKGYSWYEEGRMLNKKNTFSDFITCAEFLINKKYTSPSHLYIYGSSAGGLLIGNVINQRPDLFYGAIASVPFVDVLTTMLDETIPLTTFEYEEWGNPNIKKYYDLIQSYSPYDNILPQNYPHLLVTSGLHDSQVQYWEPAKWVSKLRHMKKDSHLLLFHIDMDSGHFGSMGRFKSLHKVSRIYAFLFLLEKLRNASL